MCRNNFSGMWFRYSMVNQIKTYEERCESLEEKEEE